MVFAGINNKLIGMMGAFQTDEDADNQIAHIMAVYVSKEARGKGVSKLMMKRLLAKLNSSSSIRTVKL